MSEKPNILLIMTDQHRADHVGFMGNPTVRTPNLDSLASSGCVFEKLPLEYPLAAKLSILGVCVSNDCNRNEVVVGKLVVGR